ncbi:hypothetical protein [Allohahella marinimesophila]|uniref:Uncharacterized protein n=1 Tax=Allohahella marinimesophila TaxID=1054972 RepID=A0ABP7QCX2_9GAMM
MGYQEFQSTPDAYISFKWGDQEMEGEFFRNSLEVIDDPLTTRGYIRPFDKRLRQSIVDCHMKANGMDLEDYMRLGDLVECDALVTHERVKRPYISNLVTDFAFINFSELATDQALIADCRADLLRRQAVLAHRFDQPEVSHELKQAYAKWCPDNFVSLRYSRTRWQKLLSQKWLHFIGLLALVYLSAAFID